MSVESLTQNKDKKISTKAERAMDVAETMMKIAHDDIYGDKPKIDNLSEEWLYREKLLYAGDLFNRLETMQFCIDMIEEINETVPDLLSKKDMAELRRCSKSIDEIVRTQRIKREELITMPINKDE